MRNVNASTRSRGPLTNLGSALQSVRRLLPETPSGDVELTRDADCCGFCFRDYDEKTPRKDAKPAARQLLISYRKLALKQIISFILLLLIAGYFLQDRTLIIGNVRFFDCSKDSNSSLVVLRAGEGETVKLCYMKFFSTIGSWLLLLPITLNNVSFVLYLSQSIATSWTSKSPGMETVPLVSGMDSDNPHDGGLTLMERCVYLVCTPCIMLILPCTGFFIIGSYGIQLCLRCCRQENSEYTRRPTFTTFFVALLIVSCDISLAIVLPFLNYYIIIESATPSELIVNMVAVHVFANLDGLIVKEVFTPQETLVENIRPFLTPNGPAIDKDDVENQTPVSNVHQVQELTTSNDEEFEEASLTGNDINQSTI